MSVAQQVISCWKYQKPKEYATKLLGAFGKPDYFTPTFLTWLRPYPNILKVSVFDEEIMHMEPARHYDFVYSTASLKATPAQACMLQFVSGSIIIDQLKGEITARCGALIKNQITLGFVYDYITGRLHGSKDQLKAEYKRRILNNVASASGIFMLPVSEE